MKKVLVSLAAVAGLSMATGVTSASAEEVVVHKGDTLWGISKEYGLTVSELKQLNHLNSDLIYPKQTLTVSAENKETQVSHAAESTSNNHTVKSGDTLWGISKNYGTSVGNLKAWNGLTSDLIYPGQLLSVSGKSSTPSVAASTTQQSVSKTSASTSTSTKTTTTTSPSNNQQSAQQTITVSSTAYTAYCNGCSGITATGINLKSNPNQKVIAVDPSVIPLGSKVYVEGYGEAIAGDTGGAIKGNKIDVFIPNRSDALNWGRKTVQVTIYK
ncbi:peptidoglycan-binding protein [Pontibacillus halophilus JSM 076056 = DSM 19796]|uniref:Peptidoglycan-binding protein n=1 Tax=Pontibacillus halophilus JSM 076056 = DSM 19796 TaxID=1385510 RepID=A0A0A5GFL2_9BACI|nr:3D domain-containing protein [Pontibacillus halophilus]KGX91991.1 peptidoglycan-binding protein [Pontibacillus halophilus JSM 076056 = DSM 19796]